MKKLILMAVVMAWSSAAFAQATDARLYTCGGLQSIITARGFVYLGVPFQGFAVASANSCSGGERLESRSVATSDTPACMVRYCETRPEQECF